MINKLKEILIQQSKSQKSKYGANRIYMDGLTFDSQKEANRWQELKLLERAGQIRDLQRQVPFVVIPEQRDANGKLIEKEVRYIADFTYIEKGKLTRTVEDVKGVRTREYILKRKLMLYRNGIKIMEV